MASLRCWLVVCLCQAQAVLALAQAPFAYQLITPAMTAARDTILAGAFATNTSFDRLAYLCDTFGPRFSGTPGLEAALDWLAATARADGLLVTEEPVMVPRWVRGNEYAQLRAPRNKTLHFLGLGGSINTGGAEIVAPVLVVDSLADLAARNASGAARGKIVVFNVPFVSYGATVGNRVNGAAWAASAGGVAALIRSIGPFGIQTPHTGGSNPASVPCGCISMEDATQLQRMQDRGQPIEIALYMEASTLADAPSRNLLLDIVGAELPDETVIISGHSDSWDVAEGGMDDGGGIAATLEALRIMLVAITAGALPRPRRTIRGVMWVNEENGLRGGLAYADDYAPTLSKTSIAIESDEGAFQPWALNVFAHQSAYNQLSLLAPLLDPIGAGNVSRAGGPPGADIGPLCRRFPDDLVPGASIMVQDPRSSLTSAYNSHLCAPFQAGARMPSPLLSIPDGYFFYHHSAGDTVDVMDPLQMQAVAASLAVWSFTIANLPTLLPRSGVVPPMPTPAPASGGTSAATIGVAVGVTLTGVAAAATAAFVLRRRGWRLPTFADVSRGAGARAARFDAGAAYSQIDAAAPR